jgi:hypothetical protein
MLIFCFVFFYQDYEKKFKKIYKLIKYQLSGHLHRITGIDIFKTKHYIVK